MRYLLLVWGALLFAAPVGFADSRHYEAANCEFHIEKIQLIPGSYQSINANLYLKVALPHLDGEIKEIGFRAQSRVRTTNGIAETTPWQNIAAEKVNPFGGEDQWKLSLLLEAGGYSTVHEGVFYLQTTEGTWYWLHPMHRGSQNFLIDTNTFTIDRELIWDEMWVNDYEKLRGFNPEQCK